MEESSDSNKWRTFNEHETLKKTERKKGERLTHHVSLSFTILAQTARNLSLVNVEATAFDALTTKLESLDLTAVEDWADWSASTNFQFFVRKSCVDFFFRFSLVFFYWLSAFKERKIKYKSLNLKLKICCNVVWWEEVWLKGFGERKYDRGKDTWFKEWNS